MKQALIKQATIKGRKKKQATRHEHDAAAGATHCIAPAQPQHSIAWHGHFHTWV